MHILLATIYIFLFLALLMQIVLSALSFRLFDVYKVCFISCINQLVKYTKIVYEFMKSVGI